jgi:hypothetical protein
MNPYLHVKTHKVSIRTYWTSENIQQTQEKLWRFGLGIAFILAILDDTIVDDKVSHSWELLKTKVVKSQWLCKDGNQSLWSVQKNFLSFRNLTVMDVPIYLNNDGR